MKTIMTAGRKKKQLIIPKETEKKKTEKEGLPVHEQTVINPTFPLMCFQSFAVSLVQWSANPYPILTFCLSLVLIEGNPKHALQTLISPLLSLTETHQSTYICTKQIIFNTL